MPSGSYRRADIECPFYSSDDEKPHKQKILCESPVPGSNLSLFFRKKRDFETQIKLFCCQHYDKCEIYRAVMAAKYEEG